MQSSSNTRPNFTIGQCATLACLLEVSAPKVGNVHRGADFADLTFGEFVASAVAIGPVFDQADTATIGEMIVESIRATRSVVSTNTNLGLVLLMAPLAKAATRRGDMREGIAWSLSSLDASDTNLVYEAIRLAAPGGLGEVPEMDIRDKAPSNLIEAMKMAAYRDLVAKQYAHNFCDVLHAAEQLTRARRELSWHDSRMQQAIVRVHIGLLAEHGDTLILRKQGERVFEECRLRAQRVVESTDEDWANASDLDFWLRSDEKGRNPGATADLIGAAIFFCLLGERGHGGVGQ